MKKRLLITALLISALMCILTVGVFAAEENAPSQMPYFDVDDVVPENPEVEMDEGIMEMYEELFGEHASKIYAVTMAGATCISLFFPLLIITIVLGVMNSRAKKKIKEYQRFFGPVPQGAPASYNPNTYNPNPACNPYNYNNYQQPVNTSNTPMGSAPVGNYATQVNENNQQGGSF